MQINIFHPYTELKWRECSRLPVGVDNAQAVWLGDKLYVGGGHTSAAGSRIAHARLYIYTPTTVHGIMLILLYIGLICPRHLPLPASAGGWEGVYRFVERWASH